MFFDSCFYFLRYSISVVSFCFELLNSCLGQNTLLYYNTFMLTGFPNDNTYCLYIFTGISITIVGTFGICANLLSVIVLLKCKDNRNFHRLLAGLAIVDILLISDLILEISIVETFMQKEPLWYILAYPYFIHPGRGIIQTSAIFMVVAVATERYRYMLVI